MATILTKLNSCINCLKQRLLIDACYHENGFVECFGAFG